MDINVITEEKLEEKLETLFAKHLAKTQPVSTPETQKEDEPRPMLSPEAEKFLGCSRQKLYSLRKKGLIKAHVLGGRVYYFKSELLAAMK
jgi:hypothetical protein